MSPTRQTLREQPPTTASAALLAYEARDIKTGRIIWSAANTVIGFYGSETK